MIICLIGLSIIFLGLLFYLFSLLAEKKYNYYYNKWIDTNNSTELEEKYCKKKDFWGIFLIDFQVGGAFILITCLVVAILSLLFVGFKSEGKKDYEEYLLVKETIEYCIDNDIILDNSMLEKSIKLNKELRLHKEQKQNPWLSWFVYNDICNMEEIDLDSFKK